ncbi:hypothetical protein TSOC_004189 [Tetrabaena socialis]|uniref:Uncharacterized protein n=1 Tax=Tetrabaena socialis TaxID=47790 RepID=A0A2J8A9M5_9CHLO|nr:hypothetical protein TSOC_004189 [Tetrabaena socialis]|eukprot:PNH09224.1 hypothetical protein TSOC_004189 [Tetrabaena socialis]
MPALTHSPRAFQKSDTLKVRVAYVAAPPSRQALLERSEANKAKNKKEIQNKYCFRQAELGIGDCGGLRFIPGLTEKGKQETPQWLADLLGVEVPPSNQAGGKTLRELIYDEKQ